MAVGDPAARHTSARRRAKGRARGTRRGTAGVVSLGLLLAACGNDTAEEATPADGAPGSSTTSDTGVPSCDDVRHAVIFTIFGTATAGNEDEMNTWMTDPGAPPAARPGAADVASAYRGLGYEILYVTATPSGTLIGDQPLTDALTVWLGTNGFPVGERTSVWAWDGDGEASVALIEELARMSTAGVEIDAGYASDPEMVFPLVTGGIPRERVFTVGAAATDETSTSIPGEDVSAHVTEVQALEPVCE